MSAAKHFLICPIRSQWLRCHNRQPFWRDDKTAAMLGISRQGCPRCGRNAAALSTAEASE